MAPDPIECRITTADMDMLDQGRTYTSDTNQRNDWTLVLLYYREYVVDINVTVGQYQPLFARINR